MNLENRVIVVISLNSPQKGTKFLFNRIEETVKEIVIIRIRDYLLYVRIAYC
jgi:hypothetical protein